MRVKISILTCIAMFFASNLNAQEWQISYNYSRFAPIGLSFGYMPNNFGGYVSGKWGLASKGNATEMYSIDQIIGTSDLSKLGIHRGSYTAGLMVGIVDWLVIYGGAGYGTYGESWGDDSEEDTDIIINRFSGPEFELGLMYRGKSWFCGVGGVLMKGIDVYREAMLIDVSVQIGFRF